MENVSIYPEKFQYDEVPWTHHPVPHGSSVSSTLWLLWGKSKTSFHPLHFSICLKSKKTQKKKSKKTLKKNHKALSHLKIMKNKIFILDALPAFRFQRWPHNSFSLSSIRIHSSATHCDWVCSWTLFSWESVKEPTYLFRRVSHSLNFTPCAPMV